MASISQEELQPLSQYNGVHFENVRKNLNFFLWQMQKLWMGINNYISIGEHETFWLSRCYQGCILFWWWHNWYVLCSHWPPIILFTHERIWRRKAFGNIVYQLSWSWTEDPILRDRRGILLQGRSSLCKVPSRCPPTPNVDR